MIPLSPPLWMGVPPAEAPACAGMTWGISPFVERKGVRRMFRVQQLVGHPLRLASLAASPYAEAKGRRFLAPLGMTWVWIPASAGMTNDGRYDVC